MGTSAHARRFIYVPNDAGYSCGAVSRACDAIMVFGFILYAANRGLKIVSEFR